MKDNVATRSRLGSVVLLATLLILLPRISFGEITVDRVVFPVTLSDGNDYSVVGYLYREGNGAHRGGTLQVLIHGASYDHRYWDVPSFNDHDYSYARFMAKNGFPVLAIDLLGAGESSRPQGDFLNMAETASSIHQVLASVRTSQHGKLALVGHSNGSILSVFVQATYHDADALVLTGWEHTAHPFPFDPAALAPLFQFPYITIPDFVRGFLLYYPPGADPAVMAYDLSYLSTTISRGQFGDLFGVLTFPVTDRVADVTGPVLVALADQDLIAPAVFAAAEAGFFGHASSVTVRTLADTGHAFNLHLSNQTGWTLIRDWLRDGVEED